MSIVILIWIGIVVSFVISLLAVTANVMAMKMIAEKQYLQAIFFAIGNIIPQTLWGTIAAMSLYDVRHIFSPAIDTLLTVLGIGIMLFIAYKLFKTKTHHSKKHHMHPAPNVFKNLIYGFMLSLSGPEKIIIYIIIFTAFSVRYNSHTFLKTVISLSIGTAIGTTALWCLLLFLFKLLSQTIKIQTMTRIGAFLLLVMSALAVLGLFVHI